MQPSTDKTSTKATTPLQTGGPCMFDTTKSGARLQPIAVGSRWCTGLEKQYHSFVREVACDRWVISQNRIFLRGDHFYWLCDCNATKEMLEYNGEIAMVARWAQEFLGYHFSATYRAVRMMTDVDGLTRRFDKLSS